jgi:hypothetical protein
VLEKRLYYNSHIQFCGQEKSISSQESTRGLLGRKIHTGNGIVEADELNVPAIAARTAVSNKDSVERQLLAAKPH